MGAEECGIKGRHKELFNKGRMTQKAPICRRRKSMQQHIPFPLEIKSWVTQASAHISRKFTTIQQRHDTFNRKHGNILQSKDQQKKGERKGKKLPSNISTALQIFGWVCHNINHAISVSVSLNWHIYQQGMTTIYLEGNKMWDERNPENVGTVCCRNTEPTMQCTNTKYNINRMHLGRAIHVYTCICRSLLVQCCLMKEVGYTISQVGDEENGKLRWTSIKS